MASAASLHCTVHAHTFVTTPNGETRCCYLVLSNAEYEALLVRARATAAAQAAARGLDASAVEPVVPPRPEFPPPYLQLQPAFPPELEDTLGPQLIETWGFLMSELAVLLGCALLGMLYGVWKQAHVARCGGVPACFCYPISACLFSKEKKSDRSNTSLL
jgi:hypothetical protein